MKNIENLDDVAVATCPPSLLPTVPALFVPAATGTDSGVLTPLGVTARRHAWDSAVVIERSYVSFGADAPLMGIARDKATVDGTPGFRTWSPPV